MKLSAIFQALAVASYSTLGSATILLDRVPSKLSFGEEIKLNWSADHDYTLKMALYQSNGVSGPLYTLFWDLPMASGNMSYDWTVPNVTVHSGDRFRLELTGKGPMDTAGTTNTTNIFELPVNAVAYQPVPPGKSAYCDDSMPWQYIVAITVGCAGSFALGVVGTWLAFRLRQKKRAEAAGFAQVDQRASGGTRGSTAS